MGNNLFLTIPELVIDLCVHCIESKCEKCEHHKTDVCIRDIIDKMESIQVVELLVQMYLLGGIER